MAEHLPADGKQGMNSLICFALLTLAAFALPIQLTSTQPSSFLTFTLPVLSPIPPGRGGVESE